MTPTPDIFSFNINQAKCNESNTMQVPSSQSTCDSDMFRQQSSTSISVSVGVQILILEICWRRFHKDLFSASMVQLLIMLA